MTSIDGNAIAGTMLDVFGTDMTSAVGTCGECGWAAPLAELAVYSAGPPGVVARCPACDCLLMVIVHRGEIACVDLMGLASVGPSRSGLP